MCSLTVKHRTYLVGQFVLPERLVKKIRILRQRTMMVWCKIRITRHEQNFQVGTVLPDLLG